MYSIQTYVIQFMLNPAKNTSHIVSLIKRMQDVREQVGGYLTITLLKGRRRLTKYDTNNILLLWNDEGLTSPLLSGRVPPCPEAAPLGAGKRKVTIQNITKSSVSRDQPNGLYREKVIIVVNQWCRAFPGPRRPSGHQHGQRRTNRLVGKLAMHTPRVQHCLKHFRDQVSKS